MFSQGKSRSRDMSLSINRYNLFIPSYVLYLLLATSGVAFISQNLVNPDNLYSHILAVTTIAALGKIFLLTYANFSYSLQSKRWFLLGVDTIFTSTQIWALLFGLNTLTDNTYPQDAFFYLLMAAIAFNIQLIFGKLSPLIRWSYIELTLYVGIFILLYFKAFNADIRFLQIVSASAAAVEIINLFRIFRNLQKSDQISLK